jgi:hypothetical protein
MQTPAILLTLQGGAASITGTAATMQAVQTEAAVGLLRFIATAAQAQVIQVEAGVAVERFIANAIETQAVQTEAVVGRLAFAAAGAQSQVIQSELVAAVERFIATAAQNQTAQTAAAQGSQSHSGIVAQSQVAQTEVATGSQAGGVAAPTEVHRRGAPLSGAAVVVGPRRMVRRPVRIVAVVRSMQAAQIEAGRAAVFDDDLAIVLLEAA